VQAQPVEYQRAASRGAVARPSCGQELPYLTLEARREGPVDFGRSGPTGEVS